jgi:hypothetical protein
MTIARAREILGPDVEGWSDDQVAAYVHAARALARFILELPDEAEATGLGSAA